VLKSVVPITQVGLLGLACVYLLSMLLGLFICVFGFFNATVLAFSIM
jgi:hypothetical protein